MNDDIGRAGTFDMQDALVTFDGFTARILHHNTAAPRGPGITIGHMEGARRDANERDAPLSA